VKFAARVLLFGAQELSFAENIIPLLKIENIRICKNLSFQTASGFWLARAALKKAKNYKLKLPRWAILV